MVDRFGRLDVLHNNAALTDSDFLTRDTQVTDLSLEVWERTMAVNLRSQMLMCKHAIPEMVRDGGGSIINMSSGASLKGDRTRTAYGVSKAGRQRPDHVRGDRATASRASGSTPSFPGSSSPTPCGPISTSRCWPASARPRSRRIVGQPDDIANLVVFLASDESRYITGQMIAIDGGMSAHVGPGGPDD